MKFWIVKMGEPLPTDGDNVRLMRAGMVAKALTAQGHEVVWWASTFDHASKRHLLPADSVTQAGDKLKIIRMHSRGYTRHISLSRVLDHAEIGRKFSRLSESEAVPDLVLCALPVLDLAVSSTRYGKRHGVPVVIDVRDWWPDMFTYGLPAWMSGLGKAALFQYYRMAKEACREATAITGITPAFMDWGLEKAGRSRNRWDRDFPLAYTSNPPPRDRIGKGYGYWKERGIVPERFFIVAYFGLMGKAFDLEPAIRAAKLLAGRRPEVRFVFCGDGDRLIYYREAAKGADNVLIPGWIGAGEIHTLMTMASAGLSPLPDRPDFLATINNKTIEYLAGGLPVISSPRKGTVFETLKANGCGLSYDQKDPGTLVEAIERLASDAVMKSRMAGNAARLFKERFVAEDVYSGMAAHLEALAASWKLQAGERTGLPPDPA